MSEDIENSHHEDQIFLGQNTRQETTPNQSDSSSNYDPMSPSDQPEQKKKRGRPCLRCQKAAQPKKRKAKNVYPNILEKCYRRYLGKLNRRQDIFDCRTLWILKLVKTSTEAVTIRIPLRGGKREAKRECVIFFYLLGKTYNEEVRRQLRNSFNEAVDASIALQMKKKSQEERADECDQSIVILEVFKSLIDLVMYQRLEVTEDLCQKMLYQHKHNHNNGVKTIQQNKLKAVLQDLKLAMKWDDLYDVLDLGEGGDYSSEYSDVPSKRETSNLES